MANSEHRSVHSLKAPLKSLSKRPRMKGNERRNLESSYQPERHCRSSRYSCEEITKRAMLKNLHSWTCPSVFTKESRAKEMKRFLTLRGQQHKVHGLDALSPSTGSTEKQFYAILVLILNFHHVTQVWTPLNTGSFSQIEIPYRHASLVGLLSGHQQVMDLLVVHFKVAHLHVTLDLNNP